MSKIRLASPQFANFTGLFGGVNFVKGVSDYPVSPLDKRRLGAIIRIEDAEDGRQVGAAVDSRVRDTKAPQIPDRKSEKNINLKPSDEVVIDPDAPKKYSREELEAVADDKGLDGLREIAEPLDVKHTSVMGLIHKILEAQEKQ